MTAAQRAELKAQLEAEERAEKQKREESIAAYKSSVDEFCRNKFSRLQALSEEMRRLKEEVFGDAETLIALKDELFRTKSDRHSNQFTTSDGKITVALGYRTNDGWDDTVNVGVDKVKTFIKSLAKDEDSAALTEMVMNLLAKDRKGNLKASRVLQLQYVKPQAAADAAPGPPLAHAAKRTQHEPEPAGVAVASAGRSFSSRPQGGHDGPVHRTVAARCRGHAARHPAGAPG